MPTTQRGPGGVRVEHEATDEATELALALSALPDFTGGSRRRAVRLVDLTGLAERLTRATWPHGISATAADMPPFFRAYKALVDAHNQLVDACTAVERTKGAAASVDVVSCVRTGPATGVHPFFLFATTITCRAIRALHDPSVRALMAAQVASYVPTAGSCLLIHRDNVVGVRAVERGGFVPSATVVRAALAGEPPRCARCGVVAENGMVCTKCSRTVCHACDTAGSACRECAATERAIHRCLERHGLLYSSLSQEKNYGVFFLPAEPGRW